MNQYSRDESRLRNGNGNHQAWPRWGAIVGGSALAVYGISRRSKTGAALATAGGLLAFGGSRISSEPQELHAEASFTINVSPEEAYRFWRNFENLPRFMSHLESVRVLSERRSEWVVRGPLQMPIKWNAEIVDERENQWIVWRSEPNSLVPNNGSVQFRRAPGNRGAEVTVAIQYAPPAGPVAKAFATLFGKNPSHIVREDLRHFKQLLEAGEIPTTVGQPHGRRSAFVQAKHAILHDNRPRPIQRVRPQSQRQPQEVVA
jgi:uncharacterized membrane protein